MVEDNSTGVVLLGDGVGLEGVGVVEDIKTGVVLLVVRAEVVEDDRKNGVVLLAEADEVFGEVFEEVFGRVDVLVLPVVEAVIKIGVEFRRGG